MGRRYKRFRRYSRFKPRKRWKSKIYYSAGKRGFFERLKDFLSSLVPSFRISETLKIIIILAIVYVFLTTHRDEAAIENKIFELVNDERAKVRIKPLTSDSDLNILAKQHSMKMKREWSFEHSKNNIGENIIEAPIYYWTTDCGMTVTNNQVAKCMVKTWIESPLHYSNMISSRYSKTGIGVSCNIIECKGTQNFK